MAGTRKQRTPNFEEMAHNYDWPESLRALHDAARGAWTAYAELDAIHTAITVPEMDTNQHERGPLYTLAGQAWDLYQALCAEGTRQVAEWEAEQGDRRADEWAAEERERERATREQHANEQWEAEQAKRAVLDVTDSPTGHVLEVSRDGGETWHATTTNDLGNLPADDSTRIRVRETRPTLAGDDTSGEFDEAHLGGL